jgi:hypothetical protein
METPTREARLAREEQRVEDWFDSLSYDDRRRWFTLAEIKTAVAVPMTRLQIVLYRLRWEVRRDRKFDLTLYRGPFEQLRRADQAWVDKLMGALTETDTPRGEPQ